MTEPIWLGIFWLIFLIIDLITSAAKSSFTHARLPWLFSLGAENLAKVDKTIALMEKPGLRTALRLGLVISHFLLAGFTVLLLDRGTMIGQAWLIMLILFVVMVAVTALEFVLERNMLASPEKAVLRWTGAAGVIDFFTSPLTK